MLHRNAHTFCTKIAIVINESLMLRLYKDRNVYYLRLIWNRYVYESNPKTMDNHWSERNAVIFWVSNSHNRLEGTRNPVFRNFHITSPTLWMWRTIFISTVPFFSSFFGLRHWLQRSIIASMFNWLWPYDNPINCWCIDYCHSVHFSIGLDSHENFRFTTYSTLLSLKGWKKNV